MKKVIYLTLTMALFVVAFSTFVQAQYTLDEYKDEVGYRGSLDPQLDPIYQIISRGTGVSAGTTYFVDDNSGSDSDNGLTWDKAFKTVTYAMAISHANIGISPNYADRNTIYVRGDAFDEDWTLLAQKTNIIGVGSDDGAPFPTVKGNHVIDTQSTDKTFMGCRFFNMGFQAQTAAATFDIPANQHEIEFYGCEFTAAANSVIGIKALSCNGLTVKGCRFIRDSGTNLGFGTAAIYIDDGTIVEVEIEDNWIDSEVGIYVHTSVTSLNCSIINNFVHATVMTIDENSDSFWIAGNTLISEAAFASGYDFDDDHAVGNILTGSDITRMIPVVDEFDRTRGIKAIGVLLTGGDVNDVFVVTGGPILVKSLIVEITTGVSGDTALLSFQVDPTTGALLTPITNATGPDITGAAIGDFFYDEGDGTALLKAANGTALPFGTTGPGIIVPAGDIDLLVSETAPTTGIATIYMLYTPMVPGVTVTAP